eukprot:8316634-Prorocentrum_lima.AAC.1
MAVHALGFVGQHARKALTNNKPSPLCKPKESQGMNNTKPVHKRSWVAVPLPRMPPCTAAVSPG